MWEKRGRDDEIVYVRPSRYLTTGILGTATRDHGT